VLRAINPNYHVILIHYPLGVLGLGLLIEILGLVFWRRGTLRAAGRWMILLGGLAMIPAATSGIFAKYDVVAKLAGVETISNWVQTRDDLRATNQLSPLRWQMLQDHVLWMAVASGVVVLGVFCWLASSGRRRMPVEVDPATGYAESIAPPGSPIAHMPVLPLLIILWGMSMMVVAAYHGGEMIYRTGMATYTEPESAVQYADYKEKLTDPAQKREAMIEYYISPLQAHVIAAGVVFAAAIAAWGMSMRKARHLHAGDGAAVSAEESLGVVPTRPEAPHPVGVVPSDIAPIPSSRFWVLALLLAIGTAAGGWYISMHDQPGGLQDVKGAFNSEILRKGDWKVEPRMLAHFAGGSAIIVLTLLLAMISKWGARGRAIIFLFGLLLTVIMAGQIAGGTMLMYDTPQGPLRSFQGKEPATRPGQVAELDRRAE
jgi:hypothetical protein